MECLKAQPRRQQCTNRGWKRQAGQVLASWNFILKGTTREGCGVGGDWNWNWILERPLLRLDWRWRGPLVNWDKSGGMRGKVRPGPGNRAISATSADTSENFHRSCSAGWGGVGMHYMLLRGMHLLHLPPAGQTACLWILALSPRVILNLLNPQCPQMGMISNSYGFLWKFLSWEVFIFLEN